MTHCLKSFRKKYNCYTRLAVLFSVDSKVLVFFCNNYNQESTRQKDITADGQLLLASYHHALFISIISFYNDTSR